ncbi:MAG: hypothetical protein FIA97_11770 [Methylococcaceae bacterium]|nr:hypothetical protein [Methylococcaceae bacterium]
MVFRIVISAGLLLGLPLFSYLALQQGVSPVWFGAADFALATAVLVALLARRDRSSLISLLAVSLASAAAAAALYRYRPDILVFLPSIFIYAALALLFQNTLGANREPLITRFARLERDGRLPAVLAAYTRRLTLGWTLFFYALLVQSVLLAWLTTPETFLLFANTLNYVLVAAFFLIEYVYRRIRYHQFPHASPLGFIRMLINNRVIGGGEHS